MWWLWLITRLGVESDIITWEVMLVSVMLKVTRRISETGGVHPGSGEGLIGKSGAEIREAVDARSELEGDENGQEN